MNLGENIYRLRSEKNMSQGDLADALEVSRQSVSKWENNSAVPELEKLIKMSQLFGVTLDELAGNVCPEPPRTEYPPVEIPARQGMETRQIVGIVLLSVGLLALVIFAALILADVVGVGLEFLLLCAGLIACGVICLGAKRNPGYWCAQLIYWMLWLMISVVSFDHGGAMASLVTLAVILYGVALLGWTVGAIRSGKLRAPKTAGIAIAVLLAVSIVMCVISLFPPRSVELVGEDASYSDGVKPDGSESLLPD